MGSRNGLHTTTTFLLATSSSFTRSTIVFDGISEEMAQENVFRFGKETSTRMLHNSSIVRRRESERDDRVSLHSVIDGILVLLEPRGCGVRDSAGIVVNVEVSFGFSFARLGFTELWMFTQVIVVELLNEGLVRGFGYDTFFFQNGQNSHGLRRSSDHDEDREK